MQKRGDAEKTDKFFCFFVTFALKTLSPKVQTKGFL